MELRNLPSVDAVAQAPELAHFSPKARVKAARTAIREARDAIQCGECPEPIVDRAALLATRLDSDGLRPAINLSGVILHTGLGRAQLAPSVAEHVSQVAASYSTLEIELETGNRGDRQDHVRELLRDLTGAEDALVVNNAAAGVLLALSGLASGTDVLLSRGQMVEIGGAFRMPDIVRQSGCRLVEVGCTNRTRLSDYEEAMTEDTGAILRCHPSNYKIVGFTQEPSLSELSELAQSRDTHLIDDQGSGLLADGRELGIGDLPTLPESVRYATVSIASGDKLIGGPQAGILVGKRDAIRCLRRHPLARAVRIDKLSLAALEGTLRLWWAGREGEIPTLRYLRRDLDEVRKIAHTFAEVIPGSVVERSLTEAGSGSAPGTGVPTYRVGLSGREEELAHRLRTGNPPIIGRIEHGRLWLDPRTLDVQDQPVVIARLRELL